MLQPMSNKTRLYILEDDFFSLKSHFNAKKTQEFGDLSNLIHLAEIIIDKPDEYDDDNLDAIFVQIEDFLDQLKRTEVS